MRGDCSLPRSSAYGENHLSSLLTGITSPMLHLPSSNSFLDSSSPYVLLRSSLTNQDLESVFVIKLKSVVSFQDDSLHRE